MPALALLQKDVEQRRLRARAGGGRLQKDMDQGRLQDMIVSEVPAVLLLPRARQSRHAPGDIRPESPGSLLQQARHAHTGPGVGPAASCSNQPVTQPNLLTGVPAPWMTTQAQTQRP